MMKASTKPLRTSYGVGCVEVYCKFIFQHRSSDSVTRCLLMTLVRWALQTVTRPQRVPKIFSPVPLLSHLMENVMVYGYSFFLRLLFMVNKLIFQQRNLFCCLQNYSALILQLFSAPSVTSSGFLIINYAVKNFILW